MKKHVGVYLVAFLVAGVAMAGHMAPPSHSGSKEFERMKSLAGVWTGTGCMELTGQPVRVEYRVTGAGSALVETLFPGTPEEMVSVYYDDKDGMLNMIHYCALGNRPHMKMTSHTDKMIELELAPGGEIDADHEAHMHFLKLTFEEADKLTAEWTAYDAGQKKSVSTFTLTRSK